MQLRNTQQGIGLVEVMVALLLLAVAVLGFSAMQLTAIKATDESLMRTNALSIMRGGAEMMRANPDGIASFRSALNGSVDTVSDITADSCVNNTDCTIDQLATRDGLMVRRYASNNDIKMKVVDCPGTGGASGQPLACFIASWNTTTPTVGSADTDCVSSTGSYNKGASCFVLEAY